MRALLALILCLSVLSIASTLGRTPAFNATLREDSVWGDWRIVLSSSLYDPGEYAFQRGFGHISAGALFAPTDIEDRDALLALLDEREAAALEALNLAVSLDPMNAHAWAALGWSHARQGNSQDAMNALRLSWKTAPYNVTLADTRLNLVGTLADTQLDPVTLTQEDLASASKDAETLERFDRASLAYYREDMPELMDQFMAPRD